MAEAKLDAKFFRKAKRSNLAIQITDTDAFIPAKGDQPEIRVRLPNRREKTMEERTAALEARVADLAALEEEIEVERKELKARVDAFRAMGTGGSEVVVQNLKVKTLMDRRNAMVRPERWIEELDAEPQHIFLEKYKLYSLNHAIYKLVRRLEPLETLYVDVGAAAAAEQIAQEEAEAGALEAARVEAEARRAGAAEKARAATELPGAPDAAAAARTGAIVGQRRVIRLGKKSAGAGASSAAGGAPGGV